MIRLSKVFPTLDCSSCITTPKMAAAAHHENITLFTYCDLSSLKRNSDAIIASITQKPRYVNPDTCIGCGECIARCRDEAVSFSWGVMGRELEERIVEHALGTVRALSGRIAYVTGVVSVTKDCDCLGLNQPPLLPDIGFFASTDPVALDKAVHDAITERAGKTLEAMSYPKHDGTHQIRYAEKIGLGSSTYTLIPVG